ncbi:MAG: glutamine synthetase [Gammaproteobacteria bacterium]|nr:glutamine synthetase [Gammaproteobacteria bacterium]
MKLLDARGASRVYVAVCDLQGQLRGKAVSRAKFETYLRHGVPTPPIFAVTDFNDAIFAVHAGAAAGRLGDALARIDPDSRREIPWEPAHGNLLFLSEMLGEDAQYDPRAVYRRVEARVAARGFRPLQSVEYEFSLFNETHDSVHAKEFRGLTPVTRESGLYGLWRQSARAEFWEELIAGMGRLGIALDACHWELSPGAVEVVMACETGLRAADNAAVFKAFAKAYAERKGCLATFMARCSHERPGHSGHVHVSLQDKRGRYVFHDAGGEHQMSTMFLRFIAGLQVFLPELVLLLLPNINSFRRLSESAWSCDPRYCLWGVDNRTVPLRVKRGRPEDLHLEVRIPGADANPYLALAAVLGAGLLGIENKLAAGAPVSGNVFRSAQRYPERLRLPRAYGEAIDRFSRSKAARELFGAEFVRVFAETRSAQEREFRDKVSDWELRRFLELA